MTVSAKNFLVAGAGRGIGRGLSRLLLQSGHRGFLVDNDRTELDNTSYLLGRQFKRGKDFESLLCDLRKPTEIKQAADSAAWLFGHHLDCLVNNAAYTGGVGGSSLADLTIDEWNQTRGCVIHMSSTRALRSEPNNGPYSATKAGLLGLSQSMAVSLSKEGIRVSCVLPGWIHVADENFGADERGASWEEGLSEEDGQWHLTGRVGKVEDVAKAVFYLVDNERSNW